jgi:predicted dithiol-disulfide oxidoreductase (DUF899 family)
MSTKTTQKRASVPLHSQRFPGESAEYRAARDKLLTAELKLRRELEKVSAMRRQLPPGGPVPQDYVFEEGSADPDNTESTGTVRMSELFVRPKASLVVYSFMYGPKMAKACPMCTAMLDSLDGAAPHAAQRINLVVVAKSPIQRIRAYARERGWRNLRLLSSANNAYNRDYHGEDDNESQWPALNVFARPGRKIYHTFSTELLFAPGEPGQDGRHVDLIWPLWNLLDFTPEGRGTDWRPKLDYAT